MSKNQVNLVRLRNKVGDELYFELAEMFSGDGFRFTQCPDIFARNEAIRKDWNDGKGLSVQELMEKYELSRSRIYDIIPLIEK